MKPKLILLFLLFYSLCSKAQMVSVTPDHIVVVIEENHGFNQIIGSANAPYINGLVDNGMLLSNMHGVTHPSEPNYLALFSGSTQGYTNDTCGSLISAANLYTQLNSVGKTCIWYSEDLPSEGSTVCTSGGTYARKHNPAAIFSNVPTTSNKKFSDFPTDFTTLPNVSFVVPNLDNDMHNGTIAQGDTWLANNIDAYAVWCKSHNSILIIDYDEDNNTVGNQIPMVVYGQYVPHSINATNYDHYSTCKTLCSEFGASITWTSALTAASVITPGKRLVDTAAYPHPVITVQNKHYITNLSQLGSFDTVIIKSTTSPVNGTFYSAKGGTRAHPYVIINEGGPVIVTGGIDNYDVHNIVWLGYGSSDPYGFIFNAQTAGFAFPLKGRSYDMSFYGCFINGGSQEGFTAKIEVDDWVSYKFDTSVARFIQHNLYWENCKVRFNGGEGWYINSSGWFHRDQVSTRNSGKGAPFGTTGTFESVDAATTITNAATTTNYIYADPLFVDQWVNVSAVIAKTTGTVAGTINLSGSNDNVTYTSIATQTLVDGASHQYNFTYATHAWNYFKFTVTTTGTVAAKLNSYLDFYFNPPPSDSITITKCVSIAPGRSAVNYNNMTHAVFTFNKFWHLGRELNTAQGRALAMGGKVGYKGDTTYITDNLVFGSYVNNFWLHGQGVIMFERNYGDSADFYGTSANPQENAAVEYGVDGATANRPTTWIIRNNEFHGGSGGGGTIQYILYPGPAMTNKNVVCNNIDNVTIDKSNPFIYSNNCNGTNLPPVVDAGNDAAITLPVSTYTFQSTATDPEGGSLTYAWTKVSGPTYSINNAAILKPTVSSLVAGTYVFQLTATDNASLPASDNIKLTVNSAAPPNQPPVAVASTNTPVITLPVNQVTVSAVGSFDPEGHAVTYAWSKFSGGSATIANAASITTDITGLAQGVYVIRLIVSDSLNLKDTDDITITVNHALNVAPLVFAGNDTTVNLPATTVNLNGVVSDPDGSVVSTLWTNTDGCSITSASSLSTTATCSTAGEHTFTLAATDDSSTTSYDYFIDTVVAASNIPPVAIASTDVIIYPPVSSVTLDQSGTDADGTIVSYKSVIIASNYGATISSANTQHPVIHALFPGDTILIRLTVRDNDSAIGRDTTTIIVLADTVNTNPVARINRDTSTTLRQPIGQISVDASNSYDPDKGDYISSYEWKQIAGDNGIVMTGTSASILTLDNMSVNTYRFRLIVTDTHGAKDSIDFSIQGEMKLRFKIIRAGGRNVFNPVYGALWANYTAVQKVQAAHIFNFREQRIEINFLTWNGINSPITDQLIDSGQLVSLNIRENLYSDTTHYSNVDLTAYATHVDTLTNHLNADSVLLVPGNEAPVAAYHLITDTTDLDPNIQMLSIVTRIGHSKGFKVADGGVTSADIVYTTYRFLSDTHDPDTTNFLHYCVPVNRWTQLVNRSNAGVEFEIAKTKYLYRRYDTIPADFATAHMYFPLPKYMVDTATNWRADYTGIAQVTKMLNFYFPDRYKNVNEFGFLITSPTLTSNVVSELRQNKYVHQTYWNDATSSTVNAITNGSVIITTLGTSYKNSIQ